MIFYHKQWSFLWTISIINTNILASKNLSYNWIAHKKYENFQKRRIFHHYFLWTHKIVILILKTNLEPLVLGLYSHNKYINAFYIVFICKYKYLSFSSLISTRYAQFTYYHSTHIVQPFFFFGKQAQPTMQQLINICICINSWHFTKI